MIPNNDIFQSGIEDETKQGVKTSAPTTADSPSVPDNGDFSPNTPYPEAFDHQAPIWDINDSDE